jgi:hypothetical protein
MNKNRNWNLTLTLPDEPERTLTVPQAEMEDILRGLMRGETPTEGEMTATPLAA